MEQGVAQVETGVTGTLKAEEQSRQMQEKVSIVKQNMTNIAAVSEENSASAEEVSAATEEVTAQVEETVAATQNLSDVAQQLSTTVAQFQTDDVSQASPVKMLTFAAR